MFKVILSNLHLEKIIWIIKTKLIYMILCALILATGAGLYATQNHNSTYMASVSFYVYSNPDYITETNINQSTSDLTSAKYLLDSYMQILSSNTFLEKIKDELDFNITVVDLKNTIGAEAIENTSVFKVHVFNDDPLYAMEIANVIGKLAPSEVIRVVKSGGIEILDEAELPTEPYKATSVVKLVALGAAAGFILSAFIFLLRGLLDTTVRRRYEIEDLFTIPVVGNVPALVGKRKKDRVNVILSEDSSFTYKEAYSNLRSSLMFMGKGEKCPVFALTSADANEGKSLSAINLSIALANSGKKVLLIDADMRKSKIATVLGIKSEKSEGLSQFLAGITEVVNKCKYSSNLDVILSGKFPPNPAELLLSDRWKRLIEDSKMEYDFIFIDIPPVGLVTDGLAIADDVDSYIVVVRERVTKFERAEMTVRKLESVDANISGIIYNGISEKSPDYGYKAYGNEYSYK